ncbi:TIGR03842 family LLM class F420-dependent oxidoreductase [Trebonia kvetii]|uniref:TIGR03842 family LLM class F420-dependent oxidoreductase n=1 Tax=Trebonia kvetii TaxID=2480626 RepID=A0A6P2BQL3_9ACTN|nr:TIGR03842 family LLM class F420-dependent oxidoreductase [Trebonia kvetii]TVZ01304.1 TIGR03842 family LLM class F420-dependent oxidoreductase [Trebonia kvetii]
MEFGVVLQPNPPARNVVETMRRADEAGFRYGWTFDSHVLWQETFLLYPLILESTSLVVGPMVTNPGTRDWSVIASTFATLNDTYGNRTICGIGRGDSALRYIGRPPVSLATLSSAMTVIKGLAEGHEVTHHGQPLRIPWVSPGASLPMWMAGYGPKALRLVGEQADGFILQTADPDIARWTFGAVRSAAAAADRDPAAITMCVAAPAYVGTDLAHQRSQLRWFGGMVGNHVADLVARYGTDGPVPRALTDYIAGREAYDYSHHGRADNESTDFVPDSIVDRFCLVGPAAAHIERLRELASIGADQFSVYLMHDAEQATLDAYRDEIIPALS